ncbi:hypothetical protein [Streptomyces sp. 4F14]|uniref:hypothetical protein n=1 Tax=Streptomyces sp. 4F14 TaxID=3394380 RepID=UPI003A844A5B
MSAAALLVAVPAANASSPAGAAESVQTVPASSSVSRTFTLPKGTTRATLPLGSSRAQVIKKAEDTITCTLTVWTPWTTLGANPRIATRAATSCTSWVLSLSIRVELDRNGQTASLSDHQNAFSSFIETGTDTACSLGTWTAEAVGDIAYPPPFWPPTGDVAVNSPSVPVSTCLN